MKNKLIGIFVCTILIAVTIIPVSGIYNIEKTELEEQYLIDKQEIACTKGDDVDWWSQYQHDPQNTGYTTSKAPNTDNILWTFEDDNGRFNSPVIIDNKVIVGSWGYYLNFMSGRLYCLDAETGGELWIKSYPIKNILCAAASVDDEMIYVSPNYVDEDIWEISCCDFQDGSQLWKKTNYGYTNTGTTIIDDKLFFCGSTKFHQEKNVYCLNKINGNIIWEYFAGQGTESLSGCCPAFVDNKLFFCKASSNPCVYCLNASTGEMLWKWKNPLGHGVKNSPTVVDGKVYFGTHGHGTIYPETGESEWIHGAVFCVDDENGNKIWQSNIRDSFTWSSPAIYNNLVYICSKFDKVYCLNAETGDLVWDYTITYPSGDLEGSGPFSPAIADNKVYVSAPCRDSSRLYCFDAYTGEVIWEYDKPGWLSVTHNLAIADGKVFTGFGQQFGNSGFLYCFSDIEPDAPDAPIISGISEGAPGEEYEYTITTTDPQGDDVYYYVSWGDGTIDEWMGPYNSSEEVSINHTWSKKGKYEIRARAKDTVGLRGAIGSFSVTMPKSKSQGLWFLRWLERFPNVFPILRYMLGL